MGWGRGITNPDIYFIPRVIGDQYRIKQEDETVNLLEKKN